MEGLAYSDEHSFVLEITVSDGELVGKRHDEGKCLRVNVDQGEEEKGTIKSKRKWYDR
jgi:hypothetical protein